MILQFREELKYSLIFWTGHISGFPSTICTLHILLLIKCYCTVHIIQMELYAIPLIFKTRNFFLPRTCKQETGGRKRNKQMKTEGKPHRNNPTAFFGRLGCTSTRWVTAQIPPLAGITQIYRYPLQNHDGLMKANHVRQTS